MAWIILVIASAFEIGWVLALKQATDTRVWWMYWVMGGFMAISVALLSVAMRTIPIGTAYAVWTGIGAAGAAGLGIALYGDPASAGRLACIALIVAGVIGLKLLQPAV